MSHILFQISLLVEPRNAESGCGILRHNAVARVGQAINVAVERFVTVGETIAEDYSDVQEAMYEACKEARQAGRHYRYLVRKILGHYYQHQSHLKVTN